MESLSIFSSISERDIDLLLVEEMNVNSEFAEWLTQEVYGNDKNRTKFGRTIKAWHSISDPNLGESDIVFIFESSNQERCAILVENKISAAAQPAQAERYKERGSKGVRDKIWNSFKTLLIAPRLYLQTYHNSSKYDVSISYESVGDWLKTRHIDKKRMEYKAAVLQEAVEQNRRGYSAVVDPATTDFWKKYWTLAVGEFPSLNMEYPGSKPAGSDWPKFWPPGIPKNSYIVHKMSLGFVDLQINGAAGASAELESKLGSNLLKRASIVEIGKSLAIRISVTPVDKTQPFESQLDNIREALGAAIELLHFSRNAESLRVS